MNSVNKAIEQWLVENGFVGCQNEENDVFCFDSASDTLYWSFESPNEYTVKSYEQFLYEYGCDYYCGWWVSAFLHELGHFMTVWNFSEIESLLLQLTKVGMGPEEYWLTPDEWAANVWAINFVNEHPDALDGLIDIFNQFIYHN